MVVATDGEGLRSKNLCDREVKGEDSSVSVGDERNCSSEGDEAENEADKSGNGGIYDNNKDTKELVELLSKLNPLAKEFVPSSLSAGDGKQAWKLLQDPSNDFDLVLTKFDIPSITGIELLHRIRRYGFCKKVPLVMMSSHHSMKYVLQSLSEGAVDFLIKPLRKNELQNIWQHVWRRLRRSTYNDLNHHQNSPVSPFASFLS